MSKLRAATSIGSFFVGGSLFFAAPYVSFAWMFGAIGLCVALGGLWGFTQHPESTALPAQRKKMVMRTRYWLFYLLTFLSGARRQIFTVFSIFLLVEHFHFTLQEISLLFLCNWGIGWLINPIIGKAINTLGERPLLTAKYLVLSCIFLSYTVTDSKWIVTGLYIVEQVLFNFTIAIRTFFQKIADKQDIAPSMALGVTINHIAAVVVPVVGGALWMYDFRIPFLMGMGFTLCSLLATLCMTRELDKARKRNAV